MKLELAENRITCPKCGKNQPSEACCIHCGIVFHKFVAGSRRVADSAQPQIRQSNSGIPFKALIRLAQLVLLSSLLLLLLSYRYRDELPPADFYQSAELTDPVQTETSVEPFDILSNEIVYTINPVQDYQLQGVVVSFHNSDTWWDIYHHRSWQDYINIKDICVIWGDNVSSGIYQRMDFRNTTWTCWASWPDKETGNLFNTQQLSNNHLLVADPDIREIAGKVKIGDQIRLYGVLASYSHSNNRFTRGTSTSRTDTGNGACETIYVTNFEILKRANPGWHKLHSSAGWSAAISLLCLLLLIIKAPFRIGD